MGKDTKILELWNNSVRTDLKNDKFLPLRLHFFSLNSRRPSSSFIFPLILFFFFLFCHFSCTFWNCSNRLFLHSRSFFHSWLITFFSFKLFKEFLLLREYLIAAHLQGTMNLITLIEKGRMHTKIKNVT